MTRFFYTDPLAGAWMAKHHSIKLFRITTQDMVDEYGCGEVGEEFDWLDTAIMRDIDMLQDVVCELSDVDYGPLYIRTDSLHLLELRPGDLFTGREGRRIIFYDGKIIPSKHARITQRSGKIFHWPESEEVEQAA